MPQGKGPFPAVVLCHGFGGTYREGMYVAILRELASTGIVGVGFDYTEDADDSLGADFVNLSFPRVVCEANAVLDFVILNPLVDSGRIGVCGHSMGGVVAMALTSQRDEVGAMAVISTSWDPQGEIAILWGTTPERWCELGFVDLAALDADWGAGARKVPWAFYQSFDCYSAAEIVTRLTQPTLVMYGEKDDVVSPDKSMRYFASLACEKRLVPIPGGNHIFSNRDSLAKAKTVLREWFDEKL